MLPVNFGAFFIKTAWFYCKWLQKNGALNLRAIFFWSTLYIMVHISGNTSLKLCKFCLVPTKMGDIEDIEKVQSKKYKKGLLSLLLH